MIYFKRQLKRNKKVQFLLALCAKGNDGIEVKMEEILNDLHNPFDINGFTNLLKLLKNSDDARDFYSKIVAFYQDRSMDGKEGKIVQVPETFTTENSMGHWRYLEYYSRYFPTEHRIYINSSLESTSDIVRIFSNECIKNNIPFELKYITEKNPRSDGIVIGSTTQAYKKHIDILLQMAERYPELIKQCGTPHLLASPLNGWMGLSDENISNRALSYAESRIGIIIAACMKFLANHPELQDEIGDYKKAMDYYAETKKWIITDVEDDIELGIVDEKQKDSLINRRWNDKISNMLNEQSFRFSYRDFGKVLDKNPSMIEEVYKHFLDTCEIIGINPQMPTQYADSERDLLEVQEKETGIDIIDIESKSYVSIINEYLSSELTMQEKVLLLSIIDKKMNRQIMEIGDSIDDYLSLTGKNEKDIESGLLTKCKKFFKSFPNKEKAIYRDPLYEKDEEKFKRIQERMESFFRKTLEPLEQYQKSLAILQDMLAKLKKQNPLYHLGVNNGLQEKIDFLKFVVINYDKIKADFLTISSQLREMTVEDVKIYDEKKMFSASSIYFELEDFFRSGITESVQKDLITMAEEKEIQSGIEI